MLGLGTNTEQPRPVGFRNRAWKDWGQNLWGWGVVLVGMETRLAVLGSRAGGVGVAELEVLENRGSRADSVGKWGWYGWREGW